LPALERRFFVDIEAGLDLWRIKPGHGAPLLGLHLLGQEQRFTEELNGVGVGDAGGIDERLVGVDEDAGLLAQVFDLGVESGDAVLQIRDRKSGVVVVGWAAWGWFLVWVRSSLREAMGCAQARLVRTRASGRCQGWTGMGIDDIDRLDTGLQSPR